MPIDSDEHFKHSFEYLRHLTTLSAGAIVLQVGFVERLSPDPKYKALVAISIVSFTASIMASVISQWGLLSFLGHRSVERAPRLAVLHSHIRVFRYWGFDCRSI